MTHSRGCDGCGAVLAWPHPAVDRRTWRSRWVLVSEVEA